MNYNTTVHSTRSSQTLTKTDKVTLTLSRLFLVLVNCAMVMLIALVLKEVSRLFINMCPIHNKQTKVSIRRPLRYWAWRVVLWHVACHIKTQLGPSYSSKMEGLVLQRQPMSILETHSTSRKILVYQLDLNVICKVWTCTLHDSNCSMWLM